MSKTLKPGWAEEAYRGKTRSKVVDEEFGRLYVHRKPKKKPKPHRQNQHTRRPLPDLDFPEDSLEPADYVSSGPKSSNK